MASLTSVYCLNPSLHKMQVAYLSYLRVLFQSAENFCPLGSLRMTPNPKYEKEAKDSLGINYDICLNYCDGGKISNKEVVEIAQCLDRVQNRIRPKLEENLDKLSARDNLRLVISEWYSYAPPPEFNVSALIKVFNDPNVNVKPLARELETVLEHDDQRDDSTMARKKSANNKSEKQRLEIRGSNNEERQIRERGHSQSEGFPDTQSSHAQSVTSSFRSPAFDDEDEDEKKFFIVRGSQRPLHDTLINALSYYMRGHKYDVDLMSAFATKIGQVKLWNELKKDGLTDMEEVVKRLLTAWRSEVDATEENLMRFLRGFQEFEKCVQLLEDYTNQHRMQRFMSDTNLLESDFERDGPRASVRARQVFKQHQIPATAKQSTLHNVHFGNYDGPVVKMALYMLQGHIM